LSVPSVSRAPRGLHIGHLVGLGTEDTEKCLGSHGAGPNLDVIGLLQDTSALRPECLQAENKLLERKRIGLGWIHGQIGVLRG